MGETDGDGVALIVVGDGEACDGLNQSLDLDLRGDGIAGHGAHDLGGSVLVGA